MIPVTSSAVHNAAYEVFTFYGRLINLPLSSPDRKLPTLLSMASIVTHSETVDMLRLRIKTAKEALDVARKNPQDTNETRCDLDRIIETDRKNVLHAHKIANRATSQHPTHDGIVRKDVFLPEDKWFRAKTEKNLLYSLNKLAISIESAEVSARTGRVPSPTPHDLDYLPNSCYDSSDSEYDEW